jgi:hypothetical protein
MQAMLILFTTARTQSVLQHDLRNIILLTYNIVRPLRQLHIKSPKHLPLPNTIHLVFLLQSLKEEFIALKRLQYASICVDIFWPRAALE